MKDALSLMKGSECVFRLTGNETYQLPPEPSRQEEFEHIVMNFILDQEERVKQLEEYIRKIGSEFMQLSLRVVEKLKAEIKREGSRVMSKRIRMGKSTRGQSSRSQEPSTEDKVWEFGVFDNDVHQGNFYTISKLPIHPGDVIDWEFLATHGLAREFFDSINTDPFTEPQ
ncbi:hypothetical protein Tco_1201364 [Tanacetum coccineum]